MIQIRSRVGKISRKRLSGMSLGEQYDDNVIQMTTKIVAGPQQILDRSAICEIGITDFVSLLPPEVRERLRDALNE